jgi:serine/threonine protein kinase
MADLRVGSYRLLKLLMTGHNSQVWEAMHDAYQRRFAVKTLLPEFRHDREQIGYMKNEYLVGSTVEHPRVIRAYELGVHNRAPFLAIEFFRIPTSNFTSSRPRSGSQAAYPRSSSRWPMGCTTCTRRVGSIAT